MQGWSDDDDSDDELAGDAGLLAVERLSRLSLRLPWFAALGRPFRAAEREAAGAYLAELGFVEAALAGIADWEEAEGAARNPEWNTAWWEAEEGLRAALVAEACAARGEAAVMEALSELSAAASEASLRAAGRAMAWAELSDEALARAAAGAATQAAYQAGLVLLADAGPEHAFAHKFRLFEAGRWPLGIVGASFNVF
ncbi:MAG: hypothetical protein FJX68_15855 [Alphaproteobacteria bacterium]|nr:hypothetical protein [Alphaproteobacteria bacterium]